MSLRPFTAIVATVFLSAASLTVFAAGDGDVALELPSDYKSNYTNYFFGDRQNGQQVVKAYANDIAVNGARSDGKLPYGSIVIAELVSAVTDADGKPMKSELGFLISSGETAAILMMQRIEGTDARFDDGQLVNDWEFEVFSPAGENLNIDTAACRECHTPLTETEQMFSYEHLALKGVD